jgi:hypothetical protein
MVPEVNMNKLRIASAVAALTSALALPAWGADPTNNGAANLDQSATQQSAPATSAAPGDLKDSKAAQKARKQTPTAAMDSATPTEKSTEKSTSGNSAKTKHPPTTEMDRAAPDQKSPAASTAPASPARN